jgi:hypothetical protein
MSEPTPLPEPYQFLEQDDASLIPFEAVYSESQIKAAMDAEYQRGVADSAKEIEKLREALMHYANADNWQEDFKGVQRTWLEPDSNTRNVYEGFCIARAALKGTP